MLTAFQRQSALHIPPTGGFAYCQLADCRVGTARIPRRGGDAHGTVRRRDTTNAVESGDDAMDGRVEEMQLRNRENAERGGKSVEVGKRTAADWPLEWKCVAPRCDCRCSRVASRWRARPLVGEQAMFGRRRRWERWTWSRRRAGIRQSRCPRELHQPLSGPRGDPYARVLRSAIEIPMWVRGPSEICRWVEFRCATRFRSRKRPREPPGFLRSGACWSCAAARWRAPVPEADLMERYARKLG